MAENTLNILKPSVNNLTARIFVRAAGLDFVVGDAGRLPFSAAAFDAVINIEASHGYPAFPRFLAEVARVLRPGGPLLLSFHLGDEPQLKTPGYGGHPMKVYVHHWRHDQMTAWLNNAGFAVETHRTLTSAESKLGGIILARRQVTDPGK